MDDLRDAQVIRSELAEAPETLPELQSFRTRIARHEKRLLRVTREQIAAAKPSAVKKRFVRMREELVQASKRRGFTKSVFLAIDNAYARAAAGTGTSHG